MKIKWKKIFEGQTFHFLFAMFFVYLYSRIFIHSHSGLRTWIITGIILSFSHQFYVAIVWRLELYHKFFTSRFAHAFDFYKKGFIFLGFLRVLIVLIVSVIDRGTLLLQGGVKYLCIIIILSLSGYAFYSVVNYFTMDRAFGLDHFDESVRHKGLVKKGIYKYTQNGMYFYAVLFIYVFPVFFQSDAGLLLALFNHFHLWVHYLCTERPDMDIIYGKTVQDGQARYS